MDSKLILVVIGVIAMAFGRSEAITCYLCESVTESNCLDPFKSDGVTTCQGTTCIKGKVTSSGSTLVIRGCGIAPVEKDECKEATVSGAKGIECVCRSDRCNDGQKVTPTLYNVVIGAAMATVTAVAWMNKI